jgi:hypothetical protein
MNAFYLSALRRGSVDAARAQRARAVENAVLSQLCQGHPPSPESWAQLLRYVDGEVSREEGFRALYEHYTSASPIKEARMP